MLRFRLWIFTKVLPWFSFQQNPLNNLNGHWSPCREFNVLLQFCFGCDLFCTYRVTILLVQNLPLTLIWELRFSIRIVTLYSFSITCSNQRILIPIFRNELLHQIRAGITLKKVSVEEQKQPPLLTEARGGIAGMLQRALQERAGALRFSSSSSEEGDDDDDEWD